ncbi:metallophosphoesterase [Desulfarculus baarsii DSM 2075]|uniref:Metallophosphoesterase n=1 Tax=Desulfarculus baarsii (strain ATCC 33931 / DSM 2075 / LMG 7858 / VKM B-1802 / 2st14) TaxID=644282 RepID=E1QDL3_DESB2|nr:metallophosphoesterase [Desulfarculus baarsii]ADK83532.1 metallophosphoesterase [Desulfarculus baarsii DSM 2075]
MSWRFLLFISTFFAIYGGANALIFRWLRPVLPAAGPWRLGLMLWFGLMVLSPVISRNLESWGWLRPAAVFDVVGYYWMGLVFVGIFLLGLAKLAGWLLPIGPKTAVWLGLLATAAAFAYGYYEAANPGLSFVTVEAKLPPGVKRIRIAQIADQHLGYTINSDRLANVCRLVASQKPDIVVSTGDLLENTMADPAAVLEPLRRLDPPLGKWAVLGNHEFYMDLNAALEYHRMAGFELLRGQGRALPGALSLAGVDDRPQSDGPAERAMLQALPQDMPVVFLKHRPDVTDESRGRFDLMLCGHTHGGQMFPFGLIVRRVFPMLEGLHQLPGGEKVFVSRGSGLWGPPLRILAPPEVVIIDLVPAGAK